MKKNKLALMMALSISLTSINYDVFASNIGIKSLSNQATSVTSGSAVVVSPESDFNFDIGRGMITYYRGKDTDIVIPSSIKGVSVNIIGYYAISSKNLTSVSIPNSVTVIDGGAFRDNNLTNLSIPNSVTYIGYESFMNNNLTSVSIPNSVTDIVTRAFANNNLTNLSIPNSVTSIGNETFMNNSLTSVSIPSSVTSIGASAFNNNQLPESEAFIYARNDDGSIDYSTVVSYGGANRNNVVIPNGVTTIGDYAFANNNLTNVIIPDSVTTIGDHAFANNSLTSVSIPNNVTSMGEFAFANNNLTSVLIPNSLTTIGDYVFHTNNLTNVTIPDSVTSIGNSAFARNSLTSVSIPNSVTSIGDCAFNNNQLPESEAFIYARNDDGSIDYSTVVSYGGANRNNVVIPNGVTTICKLAFSIDNITNVTIPDSVTTIGELAFAETNLASVIIPNSVTSIGRMAFAETNLTSVIIPSSVTSIGDYAFYHAPLTTATIYGNPSRFSDVYSFLPTSTTVVYADNNTNNNNSNDDDDDDDDYTPSSSNTSKVKEPLKSNETYVITEDAENNSVTLSSTPILTNDVYKSTFSESEVKSALDKLLTNSISTREYTLELKATNITDDSKKVSLEIPYNALTLISQNENVLLKMNYDTLGAITLDNASIIDIMSNNTPIKIELQNTNNTSEITILSGDNVIYRVDGDVKVTLPKLSDGNVITLTQKGAPSLVKKSVVNDNSVNAIIDGSGIVKTLYNTNNFTDVNNFDWYNNSVDFVNSRWLLLGLDDNNFAPNENMSRAMLATVLLRLEDGTVSNQNTTFNDVNKDDWFFDGVSWASNSGIINGTGDGSFAPEQDITREQLATMIYNYANYIGMDTTQTGHMYYYSDNSEVSDWAFYAVSWANGVGILNGDGEHLNPKETATRAEVSAVIERLVSLIVE